MINWSIDAMHGGAFPDTKGDTDVHLTSTRTDAERPRE